MYMMYFPGLPGSFSHGFYIRWLLISLCAHMGSSRTYDLLNAFGYIERVVKPDFSRKRPIEHHTCATCSELQSYISTMI